jgi:hypothetical protein
MLLGGEDKDRVLTLAEDKGHLLQCFRDGEHRWHSMDSPGIA